MYSLKDNYDPEYKFNQAIINSNDIPIYVFIKEGTVCTLNGIYKYVEYVVENDGSKWFRLKKINSIDVDVPMTKEEYDNELNKKVEEAKKSSEGKESKEIGNRNPKKVKTLVNEFKRDPEVIVEV